MLCPRGNNFHTCGEKIPKCVRALATVSGPECADRLCRTPLRSNLSSHCWLHTRAGRYISGVNAPYVPLNAQTPANFVGSTLALWLTNPIADETFPASWIAAFTRVPSGLVSGS